LILQSDSVAGIAAAEPASVSAEQVGPRPEPGTELELALAHERLVTVAPAGTVPAAVAEPA
jgi:hypothetical protein